MKVTPHYNWHWNKDEFAVSSTHTLSTCMRTCTWCTCIDMSTCTCTLCTCIKMCTCTCTIFVCYLFWLSCTHFFKETVILKGQFCKLDSCYWNRMTLNLHDATTMYDSAFSYHMLITSLYIFIRVRWCFITYITWQSISPQDWCQSDTYN